MTRIAILGSTGSIGTSALSVVDTHPTASRWWRSRPAATSRLFAEQVRKYCPRIAALASAEGAGDA